MTASIESEMQTAVRKVREKLSSSAENFSDLDLQLCRRLDWRFLLQDTRLENVAYLGKERPLLVAALKKFSDHLTIVSPKTAKALSQTFDLAVATSATSAVFQCATQILKLNGWIYVEAGPKLQGLNGYRAALLSAGFRDIQTYWHRPNFEACREIVPLDDGVTLDYVLSRPQSGFAGKIKSGAGRLATRTGLLPFVLPSVGLVARKYSES